MQPLSQDEHHHDPPRTQLCKLISATWVRSKSVAHICALKHHLSDINICPNASFIGIYPEQYESFSWNKMFVPNFDSKNNCNFHMTKRVLDVNTRTILYLLLNLERFHLS